MKKTDFSPISMPSPSLPLLPRFSTSAFAISQRVSLNKRQKNKIQRSKRILSNISSSEKCYFSQNFKTNQHYFLGQWTGTASEDHSFALCCFIKESWKQCVEPSSPGSEGFLFWGFQASLKAGHVRFWDTCERTTLGYVQLENQHLGKWGDVENQCTK